jgi:restriction system protein
MPGIFVWIFLLLNLPTNEVIVIGGSVVTILFIIIYWKNRRGFKEPSSYYTKPTLESISKMAIVEADSNRVEVSHFIQKLKKEYELRSTGMDEVDLMDGYEFEDFVGDLLIKLDFKNVIVTKKSGDGGVDILAINPQGEKTAIQCKRMNSKVGNAAVQEIFLGMKLNRCKKGMIITNSFLTKPAFTAAVHSGIEVWATNRLFEEMKKVEPKFTWSEYLASYYLKPEGKERAV